MRDIANKQDNVGDTLSAAEFNSINNELENVVTATGQSLDAAAGPDTSLNMLGKAMRAYGSAGQFFVCGGTANAITLTKSASFQEMPGLLDGLIIRWKSTLTNTGAVTITLSGLTTKSITTASGDALSGGELIANRYASAVYSASNNRFELINNLSSFVGSTYDNVSTGRYAGYQINGAGGGQYNTCTGSEAGKALTTGNSNTLTGRRAGYKLVAGSANTIYGRDAGSALVSSQYNVLMGLSCGLDWVSAQSNTAVGTSIGVGVATGSASYNTLFGMRCGYALDTGNYNALSGYYCCNALNSGSYNVVTGQYAGDKMTSASNNVIMGSAAAPNLTTGLRNVIIGSGGGSALTTASDKFYLQTTAGTLLSGDFSTGALTTGGALTVAGTTTTQGAIIPSGGTQSLTGNLSVSGSLSVSGATRTLPEYTMFQETGVYNYNSQGLYHSGTWRNTFSGMSVGNTWYKSYFPTSSIVNRIGATSTVAGEIVLPAGTYYIKVRIPIFVTGSSADDHSWQLALCSISSSYGGSVLLRGSMMKYNGSEPSGGSGDIIIDSNFSGEITLANQTTVGVCIGLWNTSNSARVGFGYATQITNVSVSQVWNTLEIWRLA